MDHYYIRCCIEAVDGVLVPPYEVDVPQSVHYLMPREGWDLVTSEEIQKIMRECPVHRYPPGLTDDQYRQDRVGALKIYQGILDAMGKYPQFWIKFAPKA